MDNRENALVEAAEEALARWSVFRLLPDHQTHLGLSRAMRGLAAASDRYRVEEWEEEQP